MRLKKNIIVFFLLLASHGLKAQLNIEASENFIKRVLPSKAQFFKVEYLSATNGRDTFALESRKNQIVLSGNNGISIASALYYYLAEFCHCQITWNGVNLKLPDKLPLLPSKIGKASPYEYRYYLNYCTFNYSMSWWDWQRWEKEIDWMALHGINMPLAITGEEYIWHELYREMGFSENDLSNFFCGPSFFSWFWMGNLDAWGGPLPPNWMTSHKDLQIKILKRERELGMKPVLPAFTGHVPAAFKTRYPNARLKQTNWNNGFADTYILDSEDPLFAEIAKKFIDLQTKFYGSDHLYSADTFNENEPPSDDPAYLSQLSKRVYEGMHDADSLATWVMQGWLFYSDRKFWKAPQIEALLNAVPNNRMILLDLAAEIEPVWKRTEAFYGKPWIWNMLHNFGGNISMFGRLETVAAEPALALRNPASGKMKGIGLTMEAIEQNPVLYELMMYHVWTDKPADLNTWLPFYLRNRYGKTTPEIISAWNVLKSTAYNGKEIRDGAESIITGRPTLDSVARWTKTKLNYSREEFLPAWDNFMKAIDACGESDGFQYDLVDVSRQALANYGFPLQKKWVNAYRQKDLVNFKKYSAQFLELFDDMDKLLATRKDFLLGTWIADARSWGSTAQEKTLYERNARNLITLWGDAQSPLHEYSCRQWSGLLTDFYKVRWQKFFSELENTLTSGTEINMAEFEKNISAWEWQWVNTEKNFPVAPSGNSIQVARQIYEKYRKLM